MKIIKQEEVNIFEIVEAIKHGQVIVYPTETCYGLGCDATSKNAVEKLFKIKKRELVKTALVLIPDIETIKTFVDWTEILEKISQKYWPGPLTVVVKVKENIKLPNGIVSSDGNIAFRISNHEFAGKLCAEFGGLLVSTSANITNMKSPYDIADVIKMFGDAEFQPDIVIDSGVLPYQKPSTIIKVVGEKIEIIRQGEIEIKI